MPSIDLLHKDNEKYIKPKENHDFSGKLTLKIPWKNLYNDAVVATLDGLYLLVVPGAGKFCSKASKLNKGDSSRKMHIL